MQGSDSNVTTYSPRALLSLIMLGIFAYFQYLSMGNKYFLLLTFSSYIFLALGGNSFIFCHSRAAATKAQNLRQHHGLNLYCWNIDCCKFTRNHPKRGIQHTYYVSPRSFSATLQRCGEPGHYSGGNYQTLFIADYLLDMQLLFQVGVPISKFHSANQLT